MSLPRSCWRLPVLSLVSLGGQGCGTMGGGGVARGLRDSFSRCSPSLIHPHHPGFVLSPVHQGDSSGGGDRALRLKGAVEPASPSPGYYSRMFVVTKASGGWRPIIDLSLSTSRWWSQFFARCGEAIGWSLSI